MSTADENPDDEAPVLPDDPDSLRTLFRDPGVRNYVFAGLAALAMVFLILFQRGSDLGGLLVVLLGVAGIVLRWTAAPIFALVVLTYFLVFPFGFPDPGVATPFELIDGRFRIADMILVFSVVVYLMCQYRLFGLMARAFPQESRTLRDTDKPYRRPAKQIGPGETARLLYVSVGVVLAGQFAWLFTTLAQIDVGAAFPLRFGGWRDVLRPPADAMSPPATRFVFLAGLVFFPAILARLVFGYWRLKQLKPEAARMLLQDAGWDETRRENVRIESWRTWGRTRWAERVKKLMAKAAKKGGGAS